MTVESSIRDRQRAHAIDQFVQELISMHEHRKMPSMAVWFVTVVIRRLRKRALFYSLFFVSKSAIEIAHQVQGKHIIARLAATIFLLQIARAQELKIEALPDGSVSGDWRH